MVEMTAEGYNDIKLTAWASHLTESLAAAFAISLAKDRGWEPEEIARVLNLVFLSGGKSGVPRHPGALNISVLTLRNYLRHEIATPEELKHFTQTPIQKRIIEE
jgi:hypothetical protein